MPTAPEHSDICDKSESPLASDSINTFPSYDYNAIAECIRHAIRRDCADIRNDIDRKIQDIHETCVPSAKQSSASSTSSDCSDIT